MSENRFIVEYGENNLPFFVDLEEHRDMSIKEVVDLLNEMFEKLNKKQEKSVELFFKYKKLQEENEQLKKQLELRTESDKYHQRMLMKWLCKDDGDVNE